MYTHSEIHMHTHTNVQMYTHMPTHPHTNSLTHTHSHTHTWLSQLACLRLILMRKADLMTIYKFFAIIIFIFWWLEGTSPFFIFSGDYNYINLLYIIINVSVPLFLIYFIKGESIWTGNDIHLGQYFFFSIWHIP